MLEFGDLVVAGFWSEGLKIRQIPAAQLQGRNPFGEGDSTCGHRRNEAGLAGARTLGEILQSDVREVRVSVLAHAVGELEKQRLGVRGDLIVAHLAVTIGVDLLFERSVVIVSLRELTGDTPRLGGGGETAGSRDE